MTTNATGVTSPGSPADGDSGADNKAPLPNYPYGFGYGRQALIHAITMLEMHRYNIALADLRRDLAFLDRMKTGWNPEGDTE